MNTLISWEKLAEQSLVTGRRKVLRRTYCLPDGRVVDFDIKQEGPTVCVLGITRTGKVILAGQYRPGPEEELLELPGGSIANDETPEAAARREFLEETGYSGDFQSIGVSLDCAYSTMLRYNFVATGCFKAQEPNPDENEFIRVIEMPLDEFRSHLRRGRLSDIETGYLGLDFLGLL
jgi:ADP-ribose pyrophosphatase